MIYSFRNVPLSWFSWVGFYLHWRVLISLRFHHPSQRPRVPSVPSDITRWSCLLIAWVFLLGSLALSLSPPLSLTSEQKHWKYLDFESRLKKLSKSQIVKVKHWGLTVVPKVAVDRTLCTWCCPTGCLGKIRQWDWDHLSEWLWPSFILKAF